jgi:hypothetical protein
MPTVSKGRGKIDFPVAVQLDDEGEVITSDQEEKRFRKARGGDHLITPFQCETYHFRNMYSRDPEERKLVDVETMEFIRQAILDSLWSPPGGKARGEECAKIQFPGLLVHSTYGSIPLCAMISE